MKKTRRHARIKPIVIAEVLELLKTLSIPEVSLRYGYASASGLRAYLNDNGIDTKQFARRRGNFRDIKRFKPEEVLAGGAETSMDPDGNTVTRCPARYAHGVAPQKSVKPKNGANV